MVDDNHKGNGVDNDNQSQKNFSHIDLEKALIESDFSFSTDYNTDEKIRYYKITGSEYNLFRIIVDNFSKPLENLLVYGYTNLDQSNNLADVNFKLILQDNLLDLSYTGFYSNIISLTNQTYRLLDGLKKNGYNYDVSTIDGLVKFNCEGGGGIGELTNIVWDAENGHLSPIFDFVTHFSSDNRFVQIAEYRSKIGLFVVNYLIDPNLD